MMNTQPQVWRRNAASSPFRPFDQTDRSVIKVFIKARIEKLLRVLETIKIKVI
jgi:hypothetical protein